MSPEFEKLMKDLKQEGKDEGMIAAFTSMIKKGLITVSDAAKDMNMSEKEFRELMSA